MDSNLPSGSGSGQNTGGGDGTMSREEMIDMSSSWNLGCDNALLMKLKEMSNNLVSSAEDVSKNISRLERDIVLLDSRVLNATSEFLMLANNQFVENSVQDFQEESASTPVPKILKHKTKSEKESELKIKMKEAIKIGITFNEQKDHERNAQEEYKFPHLIGSPKFFSSRFCGIFDENKIPPQSQTNASLQNQQDEDAIEKRFIDITSSSTSNYSNSNAPQTSNFYESNPDSCTFSAPEIIPTSGNSSSIKSKSVHSLSSTSSLFGDNDHDGAQIGGAFSVGSSVSNDLSASCDKIIVNRPQQPNQKEVNPRQALIDDLNNAIKSKCPPPPPLSESEEESEDDFVPTGQRFFNNDLEDIFDKKPPKIDLFADDEDESEDDIFSNKEFNSKYKPSMIESITQPSSELFSNQPQPPKEFQQQGVSKEQKITSTDKNSKLIQKSNIEDLFYTDRSQQHQNQSQTIGPTPLPTTLKSQYPPQIDDIFADEIDQENNYHVTRKFESKIIEPIQQIEKKEVKKNHVQVQKHVVTDNNATHQIHSKKTSTTTTDQNPRPQPQLQPNIYSVPNKSQPPKDIFADESDDDDLFFKRIKDKSSTKKSNPIIQKLQVKKSLFDDSDSEDELIKATNSSSSTSIKTNKKLDNLFADNDDEDLFFSSPNQNNSKSKEIIKPMPNKIEPNETTTSSYSNDIVNKDLVEKDNIKKRDPQSKPKLQVKSSLFQDSDDSDDESDLFSSKSSPQSSSKAKEKPKMKPPSESIRSSNNSNFLSNLNNLLANGPTKIKKSCETEPGQEIISDADTDEDKANKSSTASELEDQLLSSQEIETTNSKSETSNLLIGPAKTRVKMMSKRRPPSKTLLRNAFKPANDNDSNLFSTGGNQPEPEDIIDDDNEENTNNS